MVLFLFIAAALAGWVVAFLSAYVISQGGFDAALYRVAGASGHYGVATSAPTIYVSDALLLGALILIWSRRGSLRVGWQLAAFMFPGLIMLLFVWGDTLEQWSGLKLYATALIAFGAGRWLNANLTSQAAFVLALACFVVCVTQFIVSVAQSNGIQLIRLPAQSNSWLNIHGRAIGLYSHPDFLGVTILLLFCFLLPLSTFNQIAIRRLAYSSMALGSIAALLTLGRANSVAIGMAIVLWVILSGRATSTLQKFGIIASAATLGILNTRAITGLWDRHEADPLGGDRNYLYDVGLHQIRDAPLTGTGANYYCEVVGKYDRLCNLSFPVHNSFLYPAAELGIPLAFVFFIPLMITIALTVRRILRCGELDAQAATLFAIIPGVLAIAWTGWGLVAQEALPLWFMGFGFLASRSDNMTVDQRRRDRPKVRRLPQEFTYA